MGLLDRPRRGSFFRSGKGERRAPRLFYWFLGRLGQGILGWGSPEGAVG